MAYPTTKPRLASRRTYTQSALTTITLVLALALVVNGQSPTATSPVLARKTSPGQGQREAAPVPPPQITSSAPVPFGSQAPSSGAPANESEVKTVKKIPTSNLVLDPLPASTGDTVMALLKWSNANDTSTGNNWNLCSSRTIFDNSTANLACQFFGYPGGGYRLQNPAALLSQKPYMVSLPLFTCPPDAASFKDCTSGDLIRGAACPETDIIAVKCYGEGSLRLVGGTDDSQGRLQMFWDGAWNNLCSSNIVNTTANTVCSLMGFPNTIAQRLQSSNYDPRSTRYAEPHLWVPYVSCSGGEPSIKRCFSDSAPYRVNGTSNEKCYTTNADAALVCKPAVKNAARPAAAAAGALWVSVLLAVLYVVAS